MNIHPLFVHFPIALLVMYSVLEIVVAFSPRLRHMPWIVPTKTFLLYTGVLSAFVALGTGDMAAEALQGSANRMAIVELHEPFAAATTFVYLVLAAAYLVRLFEAKGWGDRIVGHHAWFGRVWELKMRFARLVVDTPLLLLLALTGLALITITGGLGASIVYGPEVDPFVSFIYHLFFAR